MPVAERLATLRLRRSQPEQGKTVTVHVEGEQGQPLGMLQLSFDEWIGFSRLLQRGMDSNAREQYPIKLKVAIEGYVPGERVGKPAKEPTRTRTLPLTNQPAALSVKVTPEAAAEMQAEEDAEAELQSILAEATVEPPSEVTERLIRTLKGGED